MGPSVGCSASTKRPTASKCSSRLQLLQVGHLRRRNAVGGAEGHPLRDGLGDDDVVHQSVELVRVVDAVGRGAEPFVAREFGAAAELEEQIPRLQRVREDADPAVDRAPRPTVRCANPLVAELTLLGFERLTAEMLDQVERSHGLRHRHLDRTARAVRRATGERARDGECDVQAGDLVGHDPGHEHRRVVVPRERRCQPRGRLDDVVVCSLVGSGSITAEAVGDAVDDVGPDPRARSPRRVRVGRGRIDGGWSP